MTPEQRRLRGRLAAFASHVGHPEGERTAPLRRGFEEQFVRQARERFPGAGEREIEREARLIRGQYFARLSYAAAAARTRKRGEAA